MKVPLTADARNRRSGIVGTYERFEITREDTSVADDYDTVREILASAETMEAIREGIADLESGRVFSPEEVEAELRRTGRV